MQAKSKGFSDVLFLDAVNNKYLEEASSCNIFIVKVLNNFKYNFNLNTNYKKCVYLEYINMIFVVIISN